MIEIITLLSIFAQTLPRTDQRRLAKIVMAMLRMTGRVTMLGISRWTDKGASYRTVHCFFHATLPWASMRWLFNAALMILNTGLHLVSELRYDAAL